MELFRAEIEYRDRLADPDPAFKGVKHREIPPTAFPEKVTEVFVAVPGSYDMIGEAASKAIRAVLGNSAVLDVWMPNVRRIEHLSSVFVNCGRAPGGGRDRGDPIPGGSSRGEA